MKTFSVSAPGKLHLLGEHTVVYGKPAIIAAVDKRCYVDITKRVDKKISISLAIHSFCHQDRQKRDFSIGEIFEKTKKAQYIWEDYRKTSDITELKNFLADPFDFIAIVIGETALFYQKTFSSGFSLSITPDIPLGSGMGSSAAMSVATAGAVSVFVCEEFDKEKINTIAFLAEQKKHGMPSGGDNAACCYGGLIWYQKTPEKKTIRPLSFSISQESAKNFMIIQTGKPEESTGEMVTLVSSKLKGLYPTGYESAKFEKIFDEQEKLVYKLLSAIEKSDEKGMMKIITQGENNLEQLGVVSDSTKKLIREIENAGGAAKICGAGGRKNASGIVLAFHKNPDNIIKIAEQFQLDCASVIVGSEGVKEEKYE